ncbi:MAG: RidA family protein [Pseudohongiellaceae bacterium]
MTDLKVIETGKAPKAIGPYSQAIIVDNLVFVSGQIALEPEDMRLIDGDTSDQAEQVFRNLRAVAQAAGTSLSRAVKLTVYLTDMADFADVNEVMARHFSEPFPARATVAVKTLPKNATVEIDAILTL